MDQELHGVPPTSCLKYLDDLIVHGRSFSEILAHLEQVLQKLERAGLKLNPKKCHLFQRKVDYLGHVISAEGVATDPKKIEVVTKWPQPASKMDVRSFLGLCSYYRRFVPSFADVTRPLHVLTEERSPFLWTNSCQQAFEALKTALTQTPILVLPTVDDDFILDTDASNVGIGAVLSRTKDGKEQVIAFFSRALSKPERNYCTTRKELLALVKAVHHFHHYLYGRQFMVRTDHSALQWLMKFRTPEGHIARWLQKLQDYDFKVLYRAGRKHGKADQCPEDPVQKTASTAQGPKRNKTTPTSAECNGQR